MGTFSYRKRPVVIEAFQYTEDDPNLTKAYPQWFLAAVAKGIVIDTSEGLAITTLEGNMLVSDTDWIIQGLMGELYPCKDHIFKATYEKAE